MRSAGLVLVLAACGPTDLYEVDSWTENQGGCDLEGAEVADARPPLVVLYPAGFLGRELLFARACDDPESCEAEMQEHLACPDDSGCVDGSGESLLEQALAFFITFDAGGGQGALTSATELAEECRVTAREYTLTRLDRAIEIETVITQGTGEPDLDQPPGSRCRHVEEALLQAPCTGLTVVRASL